MHPCLGKYLKGPIQSRRFVRDSEIETRIPECVRWSHLSLYVCLTVLVFLLIILCILVSCLDGCLCTTRVPRVLGSYKRMDVRSPGTRITDDGELSCGCRELSLASLDEQLILLTIESSLLPHKWF